MELTPVAGLVDEPEALRPARDRQEPGPRRGAPHEMEEEPVRGVIHPVRVLDDDQRRHHQHPEQELLDRLEDALAAEGGLDLLALRRRRDLGVERDRQQGEQGHELGHHGLDPRRQARAGLLRALGVGDAGERPQQRAEREVGHGDGVLVAARGEVREPDRQRLQLLDEPRLADAGLADQLGDLALAHARRIDGCAQLGELLLAADDRQLLGRIAKIQRSGTSPDRDIFGSLRGFQLKSKVTVTAPGRQNGRVNVHFSSWQCSGTDRYDWNYSERLTVANPDYRSKAPDAIRPQDETLTVYHSNAKRLEDAGQAAPYDVVLRSWTVSDGGIIGPATIDTSRRL